jgi:hypothetical protein
MALVTRSTHQLRSTALGLLATLICTSISTSTAIAQTRLYSPIPLPSNNSLNDILSEQDIPMGGGFARDYSVKLQAGDQVAIDLLSESFDPLIMLLSSDGETIGENDDASEGGTDALLFVRITKTGNYTVRVRSFGESKGGKFSLKLTRLKPI